MIAAIKGKKVLFITTKNIDYIRNSQEIRLISKNADSIDLIYSKRRNYLFRVCSVLLQIYLKKSNKNDVIFIGFAPQLVLPFIGGVVRGKTIVIDFFISVYDTLICDRKWFKKTGVVAKACHFLDDYTLKKATYVITDTRAHADFFALEFNSIRRKFETMYLEADESIYHPREESKDIKLKDKYIVLYFGSVLPLQGVDIVLHAIERLKDQEDIYFDIIGPIPRKYHKPIQSNVNYTKWLPQEELARRIAVADLCLAGHFNEKIAKAKRTIPGKAYIYRAMEKRMILGDNQANRELFNDTYYNRFVRMGSAGELEKAILNAYYEDKGM